PGRRSAYAAVLAGASLCHRRRAGAERHRCCRQGCRDGSRLETADRRRGEPPGRLRQGVGRVRGRVYAAVGLAGIQPCCRNSSSVWAEGSAKPDCGMRLTTGTPRRFSLIAISAALITTVTPLTIGAPSMLAFG